MTVPTHITSTLLIFLLLCSALLATTLQGVQGEVEVEGPSESECRPYIEKALKQLEIGDTPSEALNNVENIIDNSDEVLKSDEDTENKSEDTIEKTDVDDLTSGEDNIEDGISKATDSVEIENENEDEGTNEQDDTKEADESGDNTQTESIEVSKETQVIESTEAKSEEQDSKEENASIQEDSAQETEEDNIESSEHINEANKSTEQDASVEETTNNDQISSEGGSDEEKNNASTEEAASSAKEVEVGTDAASSELATDSKETDTTEETGSVEDKESAEATATEDTASASQEVESKEQADDTKEETSAEAIVSAEETASSETDTNKQTSVEKEDNEENTDETSGETSKIIDTEEEVSVTSDKLEEQSVENVESAETVNTEKEIKEESKEDEKSAESGAVDDTDTGEDETGDSGADETGDSGAGETGDSGADETGDSGADETGDSGAAETSDSGTDETADSGVVETGDSGTDETADSAAAETGDSGTDETGDSKAAETADSGADEAGDSGAVDTTESVEVKESSEESAETEEDASEEKEMVPEEELIQEIDIPTNLRPRDDLNQILELNDESSQIGNLINKAADITLRELKRLYENAIKPLEVLYKYRDLSNRHFGDSEIFSKPLVLFMGPWSGGKSSIINYLLDNEYTHTSLRTGAEPSPAYFNILMWGQEPEVLDGTQMAPDFTFSGLQKFGQGLEERIRGHKLPSKLLEKINIVEIPGILEVRKQVSRVFPFNDACQWFIDRADIIFLIYDPSKLDVGPETEAILDQLKGREYQTRIILNKADQVKPEELMRVQGALIWNISPLMSSAQPPVMYTASLWSRPYESTAPIRLLQAQEKAFLRDLKTAIDKRIENKIASARRFAVRVRNHAKMVDCYLTTYYNHKSVFGNKKLISDQIIEHPQDYHIYEGLSTLTNISRYDLPDPDVYRDFFRLNPLYDFQQLSATCTYFRGCPINRLDIAIAYDLPELVGKYKKMADSALSSVADSEAKS